MIHKQRVLLAELLLAHQVQDEEQDRQAGQDDEDARAQLDPPIGTVGRTASGRIAAPS